MEENHDGLPSRLAFFGNDFPIDDLRQLFRRLLRHSKDRRFRTLAAFIHEATLVVKEEVCELPHKLKDHVPHFDTVLTLPEHGHFRETGLGPAMEGVFLIVLQLGMLIGHHEAQGFDLDHRQVTVAGLSVGLFSGAAVALSNTLSELILNGAESVRVSFRLGIHVDDLSRNLEAPQPDGMLQSWAHVVTGMEEGAVQRELSRFNKEAGESELTKVFISAADKSSVSVSGPPSRLKAAFQHSQDLRYSKSFPLPVYDGLCHAAHIYGQDDVDVVLNASKTLIPSTRPVRVPLLSSRTGKPFTATTADGLFRMITAELITGTIATETIATTIIDLLQELIPSQLQVDTFRQSIVLKAILENVYSVFPNMKVSRNDMINWVHEDFGDTRPNSLQNSKLAIVGMSCRMPGGANDLDLFWANLQMGHDAHTTVPPDRFDLETHYDPTGQTENTSQTQYGNFIDRPGYFDAAFFTMSPKEAKETDPMQRLALVTAYEAMEMAGLVPDRTSSTRSNRIGTYYGQASDDWRELNASQNIGTYAVPGGVRGFATGRINYFFKFSGPSFNIDTACSSSMAAVHAGCEALWAGNTDTVIAGGLNIITDPDNYAGLCNAYFLSKTGQCKVWDKDADGYCRADGIGSIVIKRLEDAELDNDNILAVILSAATNHSAEAISITHPHAGAQKSNYRQVLQRAGIDPLDVTFIEMHGTGTQAGDAIESESVLDVFAPLTARRRLDRRLHLGAVKSNIGHSEAAAGISSLIKTILCFQKGQIPPHIGIKTEINPSIPKDLERRNTGLAMALTPWKRPQGSKRLALVNSFGASGGNTTILLEDPPLREKDRDSFAGTRSMHPIVVSARSKKSFQANMEHLLSYLEKFPDTDIADLSYTMCGRRMHHPLRAGTTVASITQLQKFLRQYLEDGMHTKILPIPADRPSVVLSFTGQGASNRGARQELFDDFPLFRAEVLKLDRLVQRLNFPSVIGALTGSLDDEVDSPVTSQLSIVVLEIALARFWSLLGVQPSAVIGHSLGEYSALAVAGALSIADVLRLVGRRAELTEKRCTQGSHCMLSVAASAEDIESVLKSDERVAKFGYEVSCRNTDQDTVLGGTKDQINIIRQILETKSYKCLLLDIPFAFHTSQMDSILDELEEMAQKVPFKPPSIPVLSTLLGRTVFDGKTIDATYIRNQTRNPVRFSDAVRAAQSFGLVDDSTLWIECGPQPVCVSFVRKLNPQARVASSCRRNEDNLTTIAKSLVALHVAGATPCWNEYFKPHEKTYSLINDLPKYSWNETNYWIPYLGTWCIDKARLKYGGQFMPSGGPSVPFSSSNLRSSLIHQVTEETIEPTSAELHATSNLQHPDFLEAMHGHKMNGCGVATSSIWTDMALTLGEYLYRRVVSESKELYMNVRNLEVLHAQVARKSKKSSQPLEIEARLDLENHHMSLKWFEVSTDTGETRSFASAVVTYEDPLKWRSEWDRVGHLILGRIESLKQLAAQGQASQLSKNMAYTLFKNVVDYSDRYRGIENVVLYEHEAYADIKLTPERHGSWHTPPHWIDPVCHLAGLVMNGSDASDTEEFFYVTPGSDEFRLIKPLESGGKYRSYVRMFPLHVETGQMKMYAGDVYIFQDNEVIGTLTQIRFRRVPRLLMDRFFSVPSGTNVGEATHEALRRPRRSAAPNATVADTDTEDNGTDTVDSLTPDTLPTHAMDQRFGNTLVKGGEWQVPPVKALHDTPPTNHTDSSTTEAEGLDSSFVRDCLRIIASETNLDLSDLTSDATFAQLGVDSLMSLVLSEKFRSELGLDIKSSLFLECPSIGDMKAWLENNT